MVYSYWSNHFSLKKFIHISMQWLNCNVRKAFVRSELTLISQKSLFPIELGDLHDPRLYW